MQNTRRRILVL